MRRWKEHRRKKVLPVKAENHMLEGFWFVWYNMNHEYDL